MPFVRTAVAVCFLAMVSITAGAAIAGSAKHNEVDVIVPEG